MDVSLESRARETLWGVWADAADRTQHRDIPTLSRQYEALLGRPARSVLPYYVVTTGYDEKTGAFRLFIGGHMQAEGLEAFELPEGLYAATAVRPRLGLLWGPAIGAAKRGFYAEWLPKSGHTQRNLTFERHDEKSLGKRPSIMLYFGLA